MTRRRSLFSPGPGFTWRAGLVALWGVLAVAVAGCGAATPISSAELSAPRETLKAARIAGAEGSSQGAIYLEFAQKQLARARALMAEGEVDEARRALEMAETDASLALLLARDDRLKEHIETMQRTSAAIEREMISVEEEQLRQESSQQRREPEPRPEVPEESPAPDDISEGSGATDDRDELAAGRSARAASSFL